MKRWQISLALAALALSLTLVSCDAMFENNMFGGLVKRDAQALSTQAAEDPIALIESESTIATLTEDSTAKANVLSTLETTYTVTVTTDNAAQVQAAALAAGTITIATVPEAATLSDGIVSTIISLQTSGGSIEDPMVLLEELLPADVTSAIDLISAGGDAEMPASFVTLVDTFIAASDAYAALNASLDSSVSSDTSLTSDVLVSAAVNAVIANVLSEITPVDETSTTPISELLWQQLTADDGDPAVVNMPSDMNLILSSISNITAAVGIDLASMMGTTSGSGTGE